jgi:hypothetical protein
MDTQTKNPTIEDFLTLTSGSKEVGLIIARDSNELSNMDQSLEYIGLHKAENIPNLFALKKSYLVVDENLAKEAYDFAVQYPTGQVEIFNKEEMKSHTFSPDYDSLNLVLLVVRDNLNKLDAKGFDLRSVVGPAFQL